MYRLWATAPQAWDNANPHHVLWNVWQMAIANLAYSLGHPTTVTFQVVGILTGCAVLFFFYVFLRETLDNRSFAGAAVLFLAFTPAFWFVTLQNHPYPLASLLPGWLFPLLAITRRRSTVNLETRSGGSLLERCRIVPSGCNPADTSCGGGPGGLWQARPQSQVATIFVVVSCRLHFDSLVRSRLVLANDRSGGQPYTMVEQLCRRVTPTANSSNGCVASFRASSRRIFRIADSDSLAEDQSRRQPE